MILREQRRPSRPTSRCCGINSPVTLYRCLLPKKQISSGPSTQGRGTGWRGWGQDDLRCSSQLQRQQQEMRSSSRGETPQFLYAPLNDSIGGQRLVPFHQNGAGGQADGPRRGLQGRGGSQCSELCHRALAAALLHVEHSDREPSRHVTLLQSRAHPNDSFIITGSTPTFAPQTSLR